MIRFSRLVITSVFALSVIAVAQHTEQAGSSVPQQWSVSPPAISTQEPLQEWWTGFNDPEFEGLIHRAIVANLDLKIATARLAEARAFRGIARSALLPSVNASASATRNRQRVFAPLTGPVPVEFNNFQGGFDASWELDLFGMNRKGLKAAAADAVAAEDARRNALVVLLAEVGRSYVELRGFQLRLDIAKKNIAIQQDTLDVTKARTSAGLGTELDVARSTAQLASTSAVIPTLESGVETSIHRLSVLLGEQPVALRAELAPQAPVPVTPPNVPVGLPSQLLERRPDVRRAEAEVIAANARVGQAKAEFFPRIVLFGSAGKQASQLHDITLGLGNVFGAGPSISLPVFSGGRIRSQVRVQDARLQQAVLSYRSSILAALQETEDALVSYANEQTRRESLEGAVKANQESVRLSSEVYKAGLTDFLSVLDAQRELYASEDLLAQNRVAQSVDLIALYKALGGGWQSVALP